MKTIASSINCWYNSKRQRKHKHHARFAILAIDYLWHLNYGNEGIHIMAMNGDFSRSSLIAEQYKREMDLISVSLQEESQDEREERLGLVARSWSLTVACFRAQLESSDIPTFAPSIAFAHP